MRYRYCGDWDDLKGFFKKISKRFNENAWLLLKLLGFEPTVFEFCNSLILYRYLLITQLPS